MSYEVLARKWRPMRFDDVVGQDHITRTLRKAVESNRVSHAYMFSGPRGCGKTSTARILARVINCDNVTDGNPCNECPSCTGVIAGRNLDVMEIDGASHTGVAEVRDLQESIGYAPSQYRNKIYIIDEVHMLSTHAFNALLKTLEEPPPHVYFIFATTAPNKIPDTIRSRCQRHHFKRLEIREIAGQLEEICKAEKVKYDQDGLRLLARKADGSMRDGTSLLDQCITSSAGDVTADAVRGILGLIDQDKVTAFITAIAAGDPAAVLRLLDGAINEGLDTQELCGALLEGYRDLMLLATPGDLSDLLFLSKDELDILRTQVERYELSDLVVIVERLCNAVPRLKNAADPRILLESVLVDLTLLERQTDIRELVARLERAGGSGVSPDNAGASRRGRREEKPVTDGPAAPARARVAPPAQQPEVEAVTEAVGEREDLAAHTVRPRRAESGARPVGASGPEGGNDDGREAMPAADGELDLAKLQELWDGFVAFVRQKKVSLGVCLIAGRIYSFDGRRLVLRFTRNLSLQRDQVANPRNAKFLQSMFRKYFGVEIELQCFTEGEEQSIRLEEAARKQKTPGERIRGVSEEHKPVVRRIIKEFDGEIIRFNR